MKKRSPASFLFMGIGAILAVLAVTFFVIFLITYKPTVAFYNVPAYSENAIKDVITKNFSKKFKFVDLDNTIPFSQQTEQIKKSTLVFAVQDCDTKEFSNSKIFKQIDASPLETMPTTIENTVDVKNNKAKYLPILYDFYEIDVNYDLYKKTEVQNVIFWSDLISVLQKEKNLAKFPLIFDGNDSDTLINIVGMLYESFSTPEEYEEFLNNLYEAYKKDAENPGELLNYLNALPKVSKTFNEVFAQLQQLRNDGILKNEAFQNKYGDSVNLVNDGLCGVYFTTLFNHRLIDRSVISNYKSIYCPSYETNVKRKFCAPETVVFCVKNSRKAKKIIKFVAEDAQTELSSYAGIAPVNRECTVSDIQASDVRYWLAASSGPLLPLNAALPSEKAKAIAADYFQSLVQ